MGGEAVARVVERRERIAVAEAGSVELARFEDWVAPLTDSFGWTTTGSGFGARATKLMDWRERFAELEELGCSSILTSEVRGQPVERAGKWCWIDLRSRRAQDPGSNPRGKLTQVVEDGTVACALDQRRIRLKSGVVDKSIMLEREIAERTELYVRSRKTMSAETAVHFADYAAQNGSSVEGLMWK